MKILNGLFNNMVLQRDRNNQCNVVFAGECSTSGHVRITVTRSEKTVRGMSNKTVGLARKGVFSGRLHGLPTGGTYAIDIVIGEQDGKRTAERKRIRNVLVGDVWILAGQSNMVGSGGLLKEAAKPNTNVRAFYMHDQWDTARDPIHNIADSIDPVHGGRGDGKCSVKRGRPGLVGAGPGLAFGLEMFRRTRIPQGLIACAQSATSMENWNPIHKDMGGNSLYGAMLRRFHKNGGAIAGLVWYQGCAECSPDRASAYTKRMVEFVKAARRDCRNSRLPVAMVQIARVSGGTDDSARLWNAIQDQQRRLPEHISKLLVVPSVDLQVEDGIHLTGESGKRLGTRLGQAMNVLCGNRNAGLPPIAVKSIHCCRDPIRGATNVIIDFKNVHGKLHSGDRPNGFSVRNPVNETDLLFRTRLSGHSVLLNTTLPPNNKAQLHYGYGTNPFCNITDSSGRSLPAFGPINIGESKPLTPFVRKLRISQAMPQTRNMENLRYPVNLRTLKFADREFPTAYLNLHLDLFACTPKDVTVFFQCCFHCAEPMKLSALLGYDGPLKVWIDRKNTFCDPNGTNPANADKIAIPFKAAKGTHSCIIALGSNYGRAWGIRLRFQRDDTPANIVKEGLETCRMPELIG